MKKIFELSTEKGIGTLARTLEGKLHIVKKVNLSDIDKELYITCSDEKINNKDWYIHGDGFIHKAKVGILERFASHNDSKVNFGNHPSCSKIVYTTNKNLIKDGVKEIPLDFLEYYVSTNDNIKDVLNNLFTCESK